MAKKVKENDVDGGSLQHSGDKPAEQSAGLVARIETEEQARALVKTLYDVPEGCKVVIVTEDRNVFWQQSESSAVNHAQTHNLKLFRLSWQD